MRSLTPNECILVNGADNSTIYEGIMVGGVFSSIFSVAGAAAGVAWYLGTASKAVPLTTAFAYVNGVSIVTLPVALFAGIGLGGTLGAAVGLGFYYTGLVTKSG